MILIKITPEEYRILTQPSRIEMWGAQQAVARKVEAQVKALADDSHTMIDSFDIAAIQTSLTTLHLGGYIPTGSERSGGWPLTEWKVSGRQLKREMG